MDDEHDDRLREIRRHLDEVMGVTLEEDRQRFFPGLPSDFLLQDGIPLGVTGELLVGPEPPRVLLLAPRDHGKVAIFEALQSARGIGLFDVPHPEDIEPQVLTSETLQEAIDALREASDRHEAALNAGEVPNDMYGTFHPRDASLIEAYLQEVTVRRLPDAEALDNVTHADFEPKQKVWSGFNPRTLPGNHRARKRRGRY